jgi:hypothetical protein
MIRVDLFKIEACFFLDRNHLYLALVIKRKANAQVTVQIDDTNQYSVC